MTLSHFVAVNCHPFHPPGAIKVGLKSVSNAINTFRAHCRDPIDVRVFWHNSHAPQKTILDDIASYGFSLTQWPHMGNGDNLNKQIDFALAHKFDTFFRVDADDTVTAQRFIKQAEILNTQACDICGAALRYKTEGGPSFILPPKANPGPRDYLENQFLLHPSMAMRLSAIQAAGLRYWPKRLEDKAFLLCAYQKGLRIINIPILAGEYNVSPGARKKFGQKWLGFQLNLKFIRSSKAFHLLPYACALFLLQALLGSQRMRALRHLLQR
jgi:hypothetical protein